MGYINLEICKLGIIPYFLEFFPQALLISGCANMWVQFEGGKKTRVGTKLV